MLLDAVDQQRAEADARYRGIMISSISPHVPSGLPIIEYSSTTPGPPQTVPPNARRAEARHRVSNDAKVRDPVHALYVLSRIFVLIGALSLFGGGVIALRSLDIGLMIMIGAGSWLFLGYCGEVLCRMAVCLEELAKRRS